MDKLLEVLVGVATGKGSRIFWAVLIVLVIIVVIIYPYIDANILYYGRIEKRIDNLQKLVELTEKPLEENEELKEEYVSILNEMETARKKALSNATSSKDSIHDKRIKFGAGAGFWYIAALCVLFSKKNTEKWSFRKVFSNFGAAVLCFGIGSGVGWMFTLLPTFGMVGVNVVLTLIAEFVFLWLIIKQPAKKPSV